MLLLRQCVLRLSACGGRSLCQGKIFSQYGEMVAAVVQEGLTRFARGYRPAQQ